MAGNTPGGLFLASMIDDPLTPLERHKLGALLKKAAAGAPMSDVAAERERKLKADQEALIKQEREAAAALTKLQLKLDAKTTQLNALIARHRTCGFPAGTASRVLKQYVANIRAALPTAEHPEHLIEAIEILLQADYPELAEAAPDLAERMAATSSYDMALERQQQHRGSIARQVIEAGRKRRNEPPLPRDFRLINPNTGQEEND